MEGLPTPRKSVSIHSRDKDKVEGNYQLHIKNYLFYMTVVSWDVAEILRFWQECKHQWPRSLFLKTLPQLNTSCNGA